MAKKVAAYLVKSDELEIPTDIPTYQPDERQQKVLAFVQKRFTAMQAARTVVDRDWDKYQQMIDAIFEPYPDERSSSTVPLASAMIELYVAEAQKIKTEFKFKWETSKYKHKAKAIEYVWNYDWRKNKRDKAMNEWEYIAAWFGTQVMFTGYESYTKWQWDMKMSDINEVEWVWKEYEVSNILLGNADIRNFYIDDEVIDNIDQASDCMYDQWLSYSKFKNLENSVWYKDIDKVVPRWYSTENNTFTTPEQRVKQGNYVRLRNYWNIEKDMYVVIANDVIIRETPVPSTIQGKKALPFVIRVLGKKNYSIYGRGLCETLMMFNAEINNLRELLMDAIRRSNTQTLAIWSGLTFNGRDFSYDNEILTFDGTMNGNFQQISGNPPNQAIFSYMQEIYKSIAIYTGIDIQNIIGQPQQTAFQTEVQREASQKRVNVWFMNRDLAYERLADLHLDNLQTYFPVKDANDLYPEIEVEWADVVGEWEELKFIDKKNKNSTFKVTPEVLRWEVMIDVYTNTTATTINAVEKTQKLEYMQAVGNIVNGYAMAKQAGIDLDTILPLKKTLRDLADNFNIQTETNAGQEDIQQAKNKLIDELQGMAWNTMGQDPTLQPNPMWWQQVNQNLL